MEKKLSGSVVTMTLNLKHLLRTPAILDFHEGEVYNRRTGNVLDIPERLLGLLRMSHNKYLAIGSTNTYNISTTCKGESVEKGELTSVGEYASCGSMWCKRNGNTITIHDGDDSYSVILSPAIRLLSKEELAKSPRGEYCSSEQETRTAQYPLSEPRLILARGKCLRSAITVYIQGKDVDGAEIISSVTVWGSWGGPVHFSHCWYEDEVGGSKFRYIKNVREDAEPLQREPPPKCDEVVTVEFVASSAKSARK